MLAGCATQPAFSDSNEVRGPIQPLKTPPGREAATFAGGCFWARDAMFRHLKGVDRVESGFAGGHTAHPSYEQVCTGTTGQAETVQIIFDPKVISYHDLLDVFFHTHDPTTLNAQAPDVGTQYRSAVFYHSAAAEGDDGAGHPRDQKVAPVFRPDRHGGGPVHGLLCAEDYHQNYFALNPDQPYCHMVVAPEVAKFQEEYQSRLK